MQEELFMVSSNEARPHLCLDRKEEGVANSRVYVYMCVCIRMLFTKL